MKTLRLTVIALIGTAILFTACQTNETETKDVDVDSLLKIAELYVNDDVEEATSNEEISKSANYFPCFDVEIIPNENGEFWPINWIIDFGTGECTSFFGITRSGKIHTTLTANWKTEGSLRTTTYENFFMNENQVEGTRTIENTGLNDIENLTWTRKVIDGKVTNADGTIITWECTRYSEMVEGADTWLFADDAYDVTGTSNGVNEDGLSFSMEITTSLHYINGCKFPVSGELVITIEGAENTIIINYGEGECDNFATQTVGDEVTEIELGIN